MSSKVAHFVERSKLLLHIHITGCLCSIVRTQLGITPAAHWCTPLALVMALFHTYRGNMVNVSCQPPILVAHTYMHCCTTDARTMIVIIKFVCEGLSAK